MQKLEDTYGGYVQIKYNIHNFKTWLKHYIWKGNFRDIDNELKNLRSKLSVRIESVYFIAQCDDYDIKYRYRGIARLFPGDLEYSIKGYDEKINKEKINDKKYKDDIKKKQFKKEYKELTL